VRLQSTRADGLDDRTDQVRGRLDAIMIATRVAPLTRQIGIVPAAATTLSEPLLVSTQIATLDHVTGGRAGWQAQVNPHPGEGAYVGPRSTPPAEAVFAEAVDHVEVVRRLWDSWEDDAEIRDAASGRFIDRNRIHQIDFEGPYFAVRARRSRRVRPRASRSSRTATRPMRLRPAAPTRCSSRRTTTASWRRSWRGLMGHGGAPAAIRLSCRCLQTSWCSLRAIRRWRPSSGLARPASRYTAA
jgi:alkanesulfonate monooxygenase SsuD/methylene tetrahydromethanopterin reductase-like flavin-dependent oxidoreductase (luciferase family)